MPWYYLYEDEDDEEDAELEDLHAENAVVAGGYARLKTESGSNINNICKVESIDGETAHVVFPQLRMQKADDENASLPDKLTWQNRRDIPVALLTAVSESNFSLLKAAGNIVE